MKKKLSVLLLVLCMFAVLSISAAAENIAYIAFNTGDNANDGLTASTAKVSLGNATGRGVVSLLKNGGTLIVSEKMYIGSNYNWNVKGDTLMTAVYGGVDHRNPEPAENPASGVLKFKPNITLTITSNVTMDNLILFQDATIMVAPKATLTITETVTTVPREGNYCKIIVASGGTAVIDAGTYTSIQGNGNIQIGDKVTILQGQKEEKEKPIERVANVCYVDALAGNDKNDGKSAAKALKDYVGGVFAKMPVGGTVVVSGKSFMAASGSETIFEFPAWTKPVTFTSVYDGTDYRTKNTGENPTCAFRLGFKAIVHVYSDITFDNIVLVQETAQNTIYVHAGAMLTVTDTVELLTKLEKGEHYAIYLEKGAYARLSAEAQKKFTILGEGTVLPYTEGSSDIFSYALGTDTMVQLTIGSTTAYVNGKAETLDAAPINRLNRTMLPVRFLANAFGIENDGIAWDAATRTATLTGKDVKIVITIDAPSMTVNGEKVALDCPAIIENNRTYLPVRAIANALGVSNNHIAWDGATSTATLLK